MKFWNKRKAYSNWTQVAIDREKHSNREEIKKWCQQYSSHYRFYNGYYNKWYFENPKDATVFLLIWS